MLLTNRHIVLTGATSGIGREIATMLAPGNRLLLLGRRRPPDACLAKHDFIEADLSDRGSVARAVSSIRRGNAPVDGLINCAAVQYTPRLDADDFDADMVGREVAINFVAPVLLAAGLLAPLRRADHPFILNINSGLALEPKAQSAVYCATKAALDNFSRGLRAQLQDGPVRVLQAFLPVVDTPMTEGRGRDKMSANDAARAILDGVARGIADHDIGKVRWLRQIKRLSPSLASRIMQGAAR